MEIQEIQDIKSKYERDIESYIANKLSQLEEEIGYSPSKIEIERYYVSTNRQASEGIDQYVTGRCEIIVSVPVTKTVKVEI